MKRLYCGAHKHMPASTGNGAMLLLEYAYMLWDQLCKDSIPEVQVLHLREPGEQVETRSKKPAESWNYNLSDEEDRDERCQ